MFYLLIYLLCCFISCYIIVYHIILCMCPLLVGAPAQLLSSITITAVCLSTTLLSISFLCVTLCLSIVEGTAHLDPFL